MTPWPARRFCVRGPEMFTMRATARTTHPRRVPAMRPYAFLAVIAPLSAAWLLPAGAAGPAMPASAVPPGPLFSRDVLPVLQAKCLSCHGGEKQKAGLDLRSKAAALKGG